MKLTEEQELHLCNLVSRGMSLADARAKITGERPDETKAMDTLDVPPVAPQEPPKKLSAMEKKEILKKQIESAGGEAPGMNASVAKFEQALTAAKTAIVEREQAEAEAAQKAADAAQKAADKEMAEAKEAAEDLM